MPSIFSTAAPSSSITPSQSLAPSRDRTASQEPPARQHAHDRKVSLITSHHGLGGIQIRPGQHLILKNIRVGSHRTSIRLEPTMWDALDDVCAREDLSIQEICTAVAAVCEGSLTSAIRAFLIDYYRGVVRRRQ